MEILSLGEKIKRRRKELDMTLKDLAKDRITPGQISLVESGRSNPSMDLLEYLSVNLHTSVEYLMESEESQAEKISTYYSQVAESYILSGEYSLGESYIEKALIYAEKYNLEYRKAKILSLRGKISTFKGEIALAQQFFLSSNVIFIKNNNYEEIVETFLNLGKITINLKAYHSAGSYLKQAEKVYIDNKIGNDYMLGEIYYYISIIYFAMEDEEKSNKYACLAKDKFKQIYNREEYAKTLLHISEEYNENGDLVNAIKYSNKTLKIYEEINKLKNLSYIENNLGKIFYNFEKTEEAFKHFEIANGFAPNCDDDLLIETSLNICKNHLKLKNIDKCEMLLDEIIGKIKQGNIDKMIEYNLIKYRLYTIKDDFENAERMLNESYLIAKDGGLLQKAGEIAIILGKYYMDNKKVEEATRYLDQGVSLFKEVGVLQN
ncbi:MULTISPECIES: helix-turn-helix transcriptional regulator [Clostridium]|uniref:Helix-turn-helix transcriptional regulator n=1 Tax=Clostridium cibarium TaxID=2762247 RepID=A0ABR8PXY5_9CLOT|nr:MULTISPECIES: helix-turn-helix transcriptional regulator [Clostridium]MBD7913033.1 helix-turn-helix transcriptional regulator [Clostridium cibarium]